MLRSATSLSYFTFAAGGPLARHGRAAHCLQGLVCLAAGLLLAVTVLTVGPATAQAQSTGAVAGQVVDERGDPLPGANVVIEGIARGVATDRSGRYRLRSVPAGAQTVVATFLGYETAQTTITVTAEATVVQDFQLSPRALEGQELIVEGQRDILRTLERKRSATEIVDVLDLETVQQLPVQDMTEALDRLPGIHIQGQSAARGFKNSFVVIRGIQPNLNRVTLMGAPLVSTTAERAVALDVLPSNMAAQLEVVKAPTADMDANVIGGAVNIVPLSAFDRQEPYVFASFQGGAVDEQGALKGERTPLDFSMIGSTLLSESWGLAGALSYKQEDFSRTYSQPDGWEPIQQEGFPEDLFVPEGTRLEQSRSAFRRASGTLALEWRPHPDRRVRLLGSHTESEDEQTSTQTEWNYADGKANIPFEFRSPTEIFSPEGENEKEMDIDDQQERLSFLLGEGEFRFGDLTWTLRSSYARAETNEFVREWSFDSENFESVIDVSGDIPWARPVDPVAFNDPSNYTFDEIDLEPRDQVSTSIQTATDLRYDTDVLGQDGFFKAGALYRVEDTQSDAEEWQMEYNEAAGFSDVTLGGLGLDVALTDVLGHPVSPLIDPVDGPAFIEANPDFLFFNEAASQGNQVSEDYEVQEDVAAGYVMGSATYDQLTVTAGVRVEHTRTESHVSTFNENTETFGEETFSNSYTSVLPNLHVRYRVNDRLQLRGAATSTIARPRLRDLGRSRSIDFDNSDIVEGDDAAPVLVSDADVEQGNPDLEPFASTNLDAMVEYFRRHGSFYAVGVFYKNIDNPIFTQSLRQNDVVLGETQYQQVDFEQPLNAERGTLFGLEAQVQETFTFLPGPLRRLGVTTNLVYLSSAFEVPGREGEDLPFFQQPDVILAVTPFWAYRGFGARLSYQYTDEFVTGFGSSSPDDEFVDGRGVIDLQFDYTFMDRYTVTFGVENVTNESLRVYQGRPDRTAVVDLTGTQFWLGLRGRL